MNTIPFGGFVKIFGENGEEGAELSTAEQERGFGRKPKIVQAIILLAGIFMNILFAWVLFSIAYMSGMTTAVSDQNAAYVRDSHVIVLDTLQNSAAAKGGILQGDEILSYRAGGATTTVTSAATIQGITRNSGGKPITFEVQRAQEDLFVTVTPIRAAAGANYTLGISMDVVGKVNLPFFKAFSEGGKLTLHLFASIFGGLYTLIHDGILGRADVSQLSGPVGIARLVGDASKLGFVYLLSFTAFISLNLAALNLIPFPALDGGRVLFVIIEAIIRRPISPKVANTFNAIGFGILILFMLFITYKDVAKLF